MNTFLNSLIGLDDATTERQIVAFLGEDDFIRLEWHDGQLLLIDDFSDEVTEYWVSQFGPDDRLHGWTHSMVLVEG